MSGLAVNVYRTAAHEQPPCRFMKTSGVSKCVWRPRVLLRLVADRFDIVAVGIRHERGLVGGVVVGPEPRRAWSGAPGCAIRLSAGPATQACPPAGLAPGASPRRA